MVCSDEAARCTVSGPVLREKALRYAKEVDVKDFTASNGWFDRWKNRHDVAFKAISGKRSPAP